MFHLVPLFTWNIGKGGGDVASEKKCDGQMSSGHCQVSMQDISNGRAAC